MKFAVRVRMSWAICWRSSPLFDHLVRAGEKGRRDLDTEPIAKKSGPQEISPPLAQSMSPRRSTVSRSSSHQIVATGNLEGAVRTKPFQTQLNADAAPTICEVAIPLRGGPRRCAGRLLNADCHRHATKPPNESTTPVAAGRGDAHGCSNDALWVQSKSSCGHKWAYAALSWPRSRCRPAEKGGPVSLDIRGAKNLHQGRS